MALGFAAASFLAGFAAAVGFAAADLVTTDLPSVFDF